LNAEELGVALILLPPESEQVQIAKWTAEKIIEIDVTIDRAQRGIVLLREYRTRLIADVVTGKLDVREAAANLPQEEEAEPEVIEELDEIVEEEAEENDPESELQ
jgi:type I restriction enzyme S subunit